MEEDQDELQCWIACHGKPLQLGLLVETTELCEHTDFKGGKFMITSLSFSDGEVDIGINNNGRVDDYKTAYDGFRIHELRPVMN